MKFEVSVDNERDLQALEAARVAAKVADLPSFVQSVVDQAVADATQKYLPITLPEAMKRIEELEARLNAQPAVAQPAAPDDAVKP